MQFGNVVKLGVPTTRNSTAPAAVIFSQIAMNFSDNPNEKVDEKLADEEAEAIRISLNFVNPSSLKASIATPKFPDCFN